MKLSEGRLYRQSPKGTIASIQHRIELSQTAGEYHHVTTEIDGQLVRRKVIGARGWEKICRIAGVSFIKPAESVQIEREGGAVSSVRIREMIVGRADNGNLRAIDLLLNYDVAGKLATDLFNAWVDADCPEWGSLCNPAKAAEVIKEDGSKNFVPVPGGCLVYSLVDGAVRKLLREHSQWAFSADRSAATIVQRNLARRFFGFTDCDSDGCVEFTSWVMEDVNFASIKMQDGVLNLDNKEVTVEAIEEKTLEEASEENFEKGVSLADLIKNETRRLGGWQKARSLCKDVCDEFKIRWGDIGVSQDEKGLEAIYRKLKNT